MLFFWNQYQKYIFDIGSRTTDTFRYLVKFQKVRTEKADFL